MRLTPTLAFVLATFSALMPHLGSGPFWYKMRAAAEGCEGWWWSTLLYVNNVVPAHFPQQCMPWTWYLQTSRPPDLQPDPTLIPTPTPTLSRCEPAAFSVAKPRENVPPKKETPVAIAYKPEPGAPPAKGKLTIASAGSDGSRWTYYLHGEAEGGEAAAGGKPKK